MGIYKKGKNWYIDYYLKGRRKRKMVGPSKKLAGDVLKDVQVKIAKGEYLGVYEEKKIIFSEYAKEYLEYSKANKSPASYLRDTVSLNPNLIPHFKDMYLFEITPPKIERYKAARLEKVEPATVNREIGCLRHMFNKAIEWGYVQHNPVRGVKKLKEPPGRIRYLEAKEIGKLMEALDKLPKGSGRYLKPIVSMALHTGMRKKKILGLRWRDVDLENRKITILRSKNNESQIIPINNTLYAILKALPKRPDTEYVFSNGNGKPFGNVRRSFDKALEKAGIKDFVFHDLRHTFASHLVMSGCNLRTVQQLMGHKDITMTVRYSHLSRAHLEEAVQRLDTQWTPKGRASEQ